jgi:hypothetical protein
MQLNELEEWRSRPTPQNRLALGAELARLPRPFTDAEASIALEWAIGLPVAGSSPLWDLEPQNLSLALALAGARATTLGLVAFATDAFETARRIGRGRALDRALRVLLAESTNETDPCFWAAVALAFRFPHYAKFHGFPKRVQRDISKIVESERDAGEVLAEPEGPLLGMLVDGRDDLAIWDDVDERFLPCEACQKAADAKLCETCVERRAEVQARNSAGHAALEEEVPAENVFRRFPEVLNALSVDPAGIEKVLREKLRALRAEGGTWDVPEDFRALRWPRPSRES